MKIITIGGGTGSYILLSGLKKFDVGLTAVVSMMDDGGSSGILRDEFGVLPPGDARRCLLALCPEEDNILRDLFNYRFNGLQKHSLGNLIMAALEDITKDPAKAIKKSSKILNVKGEILPITINSSFLHAELEDNTIVKGETNIDIPKHNPNLKIKNLFLKPEAKLYPEVKEAIKEADLIIIGPGDLFTSIIPNLVVKGVKEAIKNSKAKKVYICNLMTKHGETNNFKASDFVYEVEKYLGKNILDFVICNNKKPSENLLKKYKEENSEFVEPDLRNKDNLKIISADLLKEPVLVRHDPDKLANIILKTFKNAH